MKGYYLLGQRHTAYGLFELWESETWGEDAPAKVTLNGLCVGNTWDDLNTFIKEYLEDTLSIYEY